MKSLVKRNALSLGGWIVIIVLTALLAAAIAYVVDFLATFPADPETENKGDAAFTFGAIVTLCVGVGLMVLVFYSSRRGLDEPPRFSSVKRDDK